MEKEKLNIAKLLKELGENDRMVCPHCGEKVTVDIEFFLLKRVGEDLK